MKNSLLTRFKLLFNPIRKETADLSELDIYSQEFRDNLFTYYNDFYKIGKTFYSKKNDCYIVFRYDTLKAIIRNSDVYAPSRFHRSMDPVLLGADVSNHLKIKREIIDNYSSLPVNADFFNLCFNHLSEETKQLETINLVDELINPFMLTMTFKSLGFLKLPDSINIFSVQNNRALRNQYIKNIYENWSLLDEVIEKNLSEKTFSENMKNMLSGISGITQHSKEDLIKFIRFLIFSGTETTASAITSCLYLIYTDVADRKKLINDSDYSEQFMNEVFRLYSPIQLTFRENNTEVSIDGITIPPNSTIALFLGAANRDPEQFMNPQTFYPEQKQKHLAFGYGQHKCLGEQLAKKITQQFLIKFIPTDNFRYSQDEYFTLFNGSIFKLVSLKVTA